MTVTIKRGQPPQPAAIGPILAPYVVLVVLNISASWGALHSFPSTWFYAQHPGSSPPWYFIGQDAVGALWASAAALLLLAFSLGSIRRLGPGVWACLGMATVVFADRIGAGVNVFLHTRRLWRAGQASSEWATFDAYLGSQGASAYVSLGVGLVLAGVCIWQYGRALRGGSATK